MTSEKTFDREIASFQPAWLPENKELHHLVVIIDPARTGTAAARRFDEMSLMTGEHLYHLIRIGGGVPVLTRADDQPAPGSEAGIAAALREQIVCAKPHLLVRIECGPQEPLTGDAVGSAGAPLAATLTQALAASAPGRPEPLSFRIPACALHFTPGDGSDALGDRMLHRQWAEQVYRGLANFVKAHGDALEETRSAVFAGSPASECHLVPLYPTATPEQKREALARQIWPEGPLPPERADWFAQMYAKIRLSNRTLIYFEPRVETEGQNLVLTGTTTDRQLAHGLVTTMKAAGREIEDRMRLLPDERALGQRLFGACKVTMARTFVQPVESAGPQTQVLYGEPLFLLDRRDGHFLTQAGDGYWGWMREEAVEPMTRDQFAAYNSPQIGVLLEDVTHAGTILRRGTRLPVRCVKDAGTRAASRDTCTLTLPEGGTLDLAAAQVRVIDGCEDALDRCEGALRLLYTPYVFGARSPIGLDCSGMVAYLSELTSLSPARDAAQQALSGRLVATRWRRDSIRTGDFIYFMDESGKIFHTGIALNATHFIHCSPPEVQISSLKPGDRLYSPHWDNTFFIAKRP